MQEGGTPSAPMRFLFTFYLVVFEFRAETGGIDLGFKRRAHFGEPRWLTG